MKYWMAIFNPETWTDFITDPKGGCGFSDNPTRKFPTMSVGDRVVCYVAKAQTWAGVLVVNGERFREPASAYPNRVPVAAETIIADPIRGAPMASMEGKLSFFPAGGSAKQWAPHVRISPRVMSDRDAEAIVAAVKGAKQGTE